MTVETIEFMVDEPDGSVWRTSSESRARPSGERDPDGRVKSPAPYRRGRHECSEKYTFGIGRDPEPNPDGAGGARGLRAAAFARGVKRGGSPAAVAGAVSWT